MKQIQDKLIKLSKAIGEKLERDQGNLSLLVFGSVATGCIINRPDLDLLLITKKGPTEKEPKNIQEEIIQGTKVQITRITPEQLKKDVNSFLDYRINQVQKGLIVFDREGLFQKYQELFRKGFEPNKKTLQRWIRDLKEDEETIMYPPREDPYLVFSCNRLALWSFRTFLILKQDFFKGPKYLENHIHRHPEISDFFCKAFASESIDLDKRVHLKNNIPSLEKDIYLTMVNDLLSDSQELEHHGRILDSKACFVEALAYYGLFLQERMGYSNFEELIKNEKPYVLLIKIIFPRINTAALVKDYVRFNHLVREVIYKKLSLL